jgi:hypothetical protein
MTLEVVRFTEDHREGAAAVFAARHRRERAQSPKLPAQFDVVEAACAMLRQLLVQPGIRGVASLHQGRLKGYALGEVMLVPPAAQAAAFWPPRSAYIGYAGHGVDAVEVDAAYHALYSVLCSQWLAEGCFTHAIDIPAADSAALETRRSGAHTSPRCMWIQPFAEMVSAPRC